MIAFPAMYVDMLAAVFQWAGVIVRIDLQIHCDPVPGSIFSRRASISGRAVVIPGPHSITLQFKFDAAIRSRM